jgi:hypothetical protein
MDDYQPKTKALRRAVEQVWPQDEVRRAARELTAYFKGRRSHREALVALKTIKRFVRAQQKQPESTTAALRSERSPQRLKKGSA